MSISPTTRGAPVADDPAVAVAVVGLVVRPLLPQAPNNSSATALNAAARPYQFLTPIGFPPLRSRVAGKTTLSHTVPPGQSTLNAALTMGPGFG